MDAAADYADAARALAHHLPAYVSYAVHSRFVAGPLDKSESVTIVVRSSDGKIVKGRPPAMQIGSEAKYQNDVVGHPPFDPACYTAKSAYPSSFDGAPVEALVLRNICKKPADSDGDFTTLYVDRSSHVPLEAHGANKDENVAVTIGERFAQAGAYLLPSAFDVRVKGSGVMFWLDITGHQSYDSFSFSASPP